MSVTDRMVFQVLLWVLFPEGVLLYHVIECPFAQINAVFEVGFQTSQKIALPSSIRPVLCEMNSFDIFTGSIMASKTSCAVFRICNAAFTSGWCLLMIYIKKNDGPVDIEFVGKLSVKFSPEA